ncbi:uncharacterized protein LOC143149087 [Ptiloglossa arizonensis]|uniref:uncharacterized protein LOC143149087 n=1 Tax=Ptiloglossa arizonensis TaxID=3350558 RepID=UPI003F9F59DA
MQKIGRKKVNEAIELLQLNRKSEDERKTEIEDSKLRQISEQCQIVHHYKRSRRHHSTSFSKQTILSEMKSHIIHRDWDKVRNLLLLLLHSSTDIEPLIWRYCFILTLYSNVDNLYNITHLFRLCIGNLDSNRDMVLKNMLLLSHHK